LRGNEREREREREHVTVVVSVLLRVPRGEARKEEEEEEGATYPELESSNVEESGRNSPSRSISTRIKKIDGDRRGRTVLGDEVNPQESTFSSHKRTHTHTHTHDVLRKFVLKHTSKSKGTESSLRTFSRRMQARDRLVSSKKKKKKRNETAQTDRSTTDYYSIPYKCTSLLHHALSLATTSHPAGIGETKWTRRGIKRRRWKENGAGFRDRLGVQIKRRLFRCLEQLPIRYG